MAASILSSTPVIPSSPERSGSSISSNRILLNFRTTVGGDGSALHFFSIMELLALRRGDRGFFSRAEQSHAERVLSKLVAVLEN